VNFGAFLKSFQPHASPIPLAEKVRSGLAGGVSILLLAWMLHYLPQHTYPLLMLGSMAASAVLLFSAPHSPFSQPWNLVGGHSVSAIAGWMCCLFIPEPIMAASIAVGTAIFLMYVLRCLHPPGAATALTLVLSSTQFSVMSWQWVGEIVMVNAGIMLLLALLINNVLPGRKYPVAFSISTQPKIKPSVIPQQTDIEWALTQMDSVIDVSLEDLTEIYTIAQNRATDRYEAAQKKL
jgi:CBS domain-containing membrane protein